jgi:uncharacterized protein YpmS
MNKWKAAFFVLAGVILLAAAAGWLWINQALQSDTEEVFTAPDRSEVDGPSFIVSSSREDADAWLQRELEEENMEDFELIIDDAVYFQSTITALGLDIPVEVRFNPEVTEDGNIWLREDGFQVGLVELPSARIFTLIGDNVDLPEWISVVGEESSLYMDLRELDTEEYVIQARELDLEENNIEFQITAAE